MQQGTNPWQPYTQAFIEAHGKEIDLRNEIHVFLFGSTDSNKEPHGRIMAVRRMRRDENGNRVSCSCRDSASKEVPHNPGNKCRFCGGEGYLFDDQIVVGYVYNEYPQAYAASKHPWGVQEPVAPAVFFEYNVEVDEKDIILELVLDEEGHLPQGSIQIKKKFEITSAQEMRGDRGRIEYIRCRIAEVKR